MATHIYADKENRTHSFPVPLKGEANSFSSLGGPKTPFAKRANLARTPLATKKSENVLLPTGGAKDAPNKFKTPFKTPNEKRVPLGGKDANARKENILTTAKLVKQANRPTSAKRRTVKQLQHAAAQTEAMPAATSFADMDVEYMPPKAIEIPYMPDDFEPVDFGCLEKVIHSPAMIANYYCPRDANGKSETERKFDLITNDDLLDFSLDDLDFGALPNSAVGEDGLFDYERPLETDSDLDLIGDWETSIVLDDYLEN
ncbi:uncharacterized protein V1516DRAFT_619240 [Lipomyces oligophaga]|uniref:uncharacterized protein n=1 Tax=Lipomyces oligophaga TaxID=45792 RepID=UPI0034CDDB0B